MHVPRISRYMTLYIAFGIITVFRNRGRPWNVLPADTSVHLYLYYDFKVFVFFHSKNGYAKAPQY